MNNNTVATTQTAPATFFSRFKLLGKRLTVIGSSTVQVVAESACDVGDFIIDNTGDYGKSVDADTVTFKTAIKAQTVKTYAQASIKNFTKSEAESAPAPIVKRTPRKKATTAK